MSLNFLTCISFSLSCLKQNSCTDMKVTENCRSSEQLRTKSILIYMVSFNMSGPKIWDIYQHKPRNQEQRQH